jgi:hypothetical protein
MKNGKYIGYNNTEEWFKDDLRHREDGPAITFNDGAEMWYRNDQCHREDGPAMIGPDGRKRWILENKLVYSDEMNNLHICKDLSESFKMSIIKYDLNRT